MAEQKYPYNIELVFRKSKARQTKISQNARLLISTVGGEVTDEMITKDFHLLRAQLTVKMAEIVENSPIVTDLTVFNCKPDIPCWRNILPLSDRQFGQWGAGTAGKCKETH